MTPMIRIGRHAFVMIAAGFAISQVVRTELPGAPPFARPLAVGSAVSVPVAA